MLQITQNTSPNEISELVSKLREQKGKEEETLKLIKKALVYGHGFVVNLLWEQALTYQHLVMNEDVKGENVNKEVRLLNLKKMADVVGLAKYYIVRFDLDEWTHRLYRFMGRVEDYKGNYKRAINYYRRSLKFMTRDPEYIENKFPRYLEVEGFLSYSLIMSNRIDSGYLLALNTYDKFETDENAVRLKERDHATWAIWRSGIAVRTITALLAKRSTVGKGDLSDWLNEVEKELAPREKFAYRLAEIKNLRSKLIEN